MNISTIQQICTSRCIFALKDDATYASVESIYEQDDEGLPIEAMCVWSNLESAEEHLNDDWSTYQIIEIPINDFIENWCLGIFNDGLVFCLNLALEENDNTLEVQPLDLAYHLAQYIHQQNEEIELSKFDGIADYIEKIKPLIIE